MLVLKLKLSTFNMLLESFFLVVYILLRVEKIWLGTDNNLRGKVFFLHNHLVMQHSLQQQQSEENPARGFSRCEMIISNMATEYEVMHYSM